MHGQGAELDAMVASIQPAVKVTTATGLRHFASTVPGFKLVDVLPCLDAAAKASRLTMSTRGLALTRSGR